MTMNLLRNDNMGGYEKVVGPPTSSHIIAIIPCTHILTVKPPVAPAACFQSEFRTAQVVPSIVFSPKWSATTKVRATLMFWMVLVLALLPVGCGPEVLDPGASTTPPPVYTGPVYLHGTVGSMTQLRGAEPLLVSGYGLVVNLRGTGSSEVPASLRQWMINEMRKRGVGSAALGTQWMTPEQLLASPDTAVVLVQGLVPPGAGKSRRFDVLVTALPQTQTTSLDGGQLWSVDLSPFGGDPSAPYSRQLATANGPLFLSPLSQMNDDPTSSAALRREAVVLSGGVATAPRKLELILNQASWQRSRMIADRINERFPKAPADRRNTAVPINDSVVELNLPARYDRSVQELLDRIAHLYTQRGPNFEAVQGQRLADMLIADPSQASAVTLAWESLGKTVLPVLRHYYDHAVISVQLAALSAGARLEDEATADHLLHLAQSSDPALRGQAAKILVHLPRSLRAARALHMLLDDPDQTVRIVAYESLAQINDPIIERLPMGDRQEFKFVFDTVPATRPLIYIAHSRMPRVILFDPRLSLRAPFVARLWNNRLMIRATQPGGDLSVFYQPQGHVEGKTYTLPGSVHQLITFLAHQPTVAWPDNGLNLSYSQVTDVLDQLCREGFISAPIQFQISPLAALVAQMEARTPNRPRPTTARPDLFSSPSQDSDTQNEVVDQPPDPSFTPDPIRSSDSQSSDPTPPPSVLMLP